MRLSRLYVEKPKLMNVCFQPEMRFGMFDPPYL